MKTRIIENGKNTYLAALFGIGLSYGLTSGMLYTEFTKDSEIVQRLETVALKLAHKPGGGHNKFLESINVVLDISAPRYWWQEFDTYRCGVTKQSESTMHTIGKRPLRPEDFAGTVPLEYLTYLDGLRCAYNRDKSRENLKAIKNALPEGYIQRRIVCTNYKTLQNMYNQRKDHRLKEWHEFIDALKKELYKPGLVIKGTEQ